MEDANLIKKPAAARRQEDLSVTFVVVRDVLYPHIQFKARRYFALSSPLKVPEHQRAFICWEDAGGWVWIAKLLDLDLVHFCTLSQVSTPAVCTSTVLLEGGEESDGGRFRRCRRNYYRYATTSSARVARSYSQARVKKKSVTRVVLSVVLVPALGSISKFFF